MNGPVSCSFLDFTVSTNTSCSDGGELCLRVLEYTNGKVEYHRLGYDVTISLGSDERSLDCVVRAPDPLIPYRWFFEPRVVIVSVFEERGRVSCLVRPLAPSDGAIGSTLLCLLLPGLVCLWIFYVFFLGLSVAMPSIASDEQVQSIVALLLGLAYIVFFRQFCTKILPLLFSRPIHALTQIVHEIEVALRTS